MDFINFFIQNEQFIFMILFIILLVWTIKKADKREDSLLKSIEILSENYLKLVDKIEDIDFKLSTKEENKNGIIK